MDTRNCMLRVVGAYLSVENSQRCSTAEPLAYHTAAAVFCSANAQPLAEVGASYYYQLLYASTGPQNQTNNTPHTQPGWAVLPRHDQHHPAVNKEESCRWTQLHVC